MTHGSLFSGIGGFDLAAEWMGWENVFHCEWNKFGHKVLKYYWPNAISYENICTTDFTVHRGKVDIITGGFPCQPYSHAGKRLGKEDERHLWPEMLRTIREVQPRWVVGENVFGLVNWSGGLVFHEVQADLEAEGYEVQPYILPAVSVNAPHRRDRVWFVAHSLRNRSGEGLRKRQSEQFNENGIKRTNVTYTNYNGFNQCDSKYEKHSSERRFNALSNISESIADGDVTNSECIGLCIITKNRGLQQEKNKNYGREKNKSTLSIKTVCNRCKSNWENFPTVAPVCTGDDGISNRLDGITFPKWRKESIKAGGNAIVPQVAYQIFKTIQAYERSRTAKEDC